MYGPSSTSDAAAGSRAAVESSRSCSRRILPPNPPISSPQSHPHHITGASETSTPVRARTLKNGGSPNSAATSLGRGGGPFVPPRPIGRGAAPSSAPPPHQQAFFEGFFDYPNSYPYHEADTVDSSPGAWDNDVRPAGGFMSYFENEAHNSHLVGAMNHSSPVPSSVVANNDATGKRIMWTMKEDERLMSAWIQHSTNSSCGADKGGMQYWGDVVEE